MLSRLHLSKGIETWQMNIKIRVAEPIWKQESYEEALAMLIKHVLVGANLGGGGG